MVIVVAAGKVDLIQTIKGLECYIRELKILKASMFQPNSLSCTVFTV